jgi:hypothetical protein
MMALLKDANSLELRRISRFSLLSANCAARQKQIQMEVKNSKDMNTHLNVFNKVIIITFV